jgi:signal transduction histidine kinase
MDLSAKTDNRLIFFAAQELIREALNPDMTLEAFFNAVIQKIKKAVQPDIVRLLLREGEQLRVRAADRNHHAELDSVMSIDGSLNGFCMQQLQAITIPNLDEIPIPLQPFYSLPKNGGQAMRSLIALPLLNGKEAVGVLSLESTHLDAFDPQQEEMLQFFANHTALAINLVYTRLEAAAMSQISRDLASQTDISPILRSVQEHALALIGGHFGQVLLLEGPDLVVHYTTNALPRDQGLRFGLNRCITGLAVQERCPIIVPDVTRTEYWRVELPADHSGGPPQLVPKTTDQPRYQRILEREKDRIIAELAVPIWSQKQLVGVLNVETQRKDGFSDNKRIALAEFAQVNGTQFSQAVTNRNDTGLKHFLEEALTIAETSFGQLLMLDDKELVIVATTGGEPVGMRVLVEESVTGQAVISRKPFYIPRVADEPRYQRYLGEEIKGELAVPLISGEQIIGVLNIESPVPGFFRAEHARVLQTLAGQAAIAIERAQRYEIERLAAIGGLASDIIHRLNNPIGAVNGWISTLKNKPFFPELAADYPYMNKFLERVERDMAHARSIMRELRTELQQQSPGSIDLKLAILNAIDRCGLVSEDQSIQVRLDLAAEAIWVAAGPGLTGIFWNLFDNARKSMPEGGILTLSTELSEDHYWVTIKVSDTGIGIDPWRLPYIFEVDVSTSTDSYAPAHGLGLWWTRSQIESFGGTIEAASSPGEGACFTIRLQASA